MTVKSISCEFDPQSKKINIYLNLDFHSFFPVSRQIAALSSTTQNAMPPNFGGKWITDCLNTRFSLPASLLHAVYFFITYVRPVVAQRHKYMIVNVTGSRFDFHSHKYFIFYFSFSDKRNYGVKFFYSVRIVFIIRRNMGNRNILTLGSHSTLLILLCLKVINTIYVRVVYLLPALHRRALRDQTRREERDHTDRYHWHCDDHHHYGLHHYHHHHYRYQNQRWRFKIRLRAVCEQHRVSPSGGRRGVRVC